ncbi:MAG: hypothetical protein ACLFNZ_11250 [Spirochaetaceae bacterium]
MRKVVCVLALALMLLGAAAAVFGEEETPRTGDYEVEGWKKRFASPTYGVAIAPMYIEYTDKNNEVQSDDVIVPGVQLRILQGMNVSKRGGFYTAYELGMMLYYLDNSDIYQIKNIDFTPHGAKLEDLTFAMMFVMSKYGYRIDLGTEAGGLSLGPVIGLGFMGGGGDVTIKDIGEDHDGEGDDTESGGSEGVFGPLLELGLEGTFRFGQNFRIVGVAGINASPAMEWDGEIKGEMSPVRPDLRVGFIMNY